MSRSTASRRKLMGAAGESDLGVATYTRTGEKRKAIWLDPCPRCGTTHWVVIERTTGPMAFSIGPYRFNNWGICRNTNTPVLLTWLKVLDQ